MVTNYYSPKNNFTSPVRREPAPYREEAMPEVRKKLPEKDDNTVILALIAMLFLSGCNDKLLLLALIFLLLN